MKLRIGLAAIGAAGIFALVAPLSTATVAEANADVAPVSVDFDKLWGYQVPGAEAEANIPPDCIVINPGTPSCYMMCESPPQLRECPND